MWFTPPVDLANGDNGRWVIRYQCGGWVDPTPLSADGNDQESNEGW